MEGITLAELKRKKGTPAASAGKETEENYPAGAQTLTPEERQQAEEIKNQLDVTDSQAVMQYGAGAKQNIADFSETILGKVRSRDSGYVGELMTGLIEKVEGLDFESLEKEKGLMGLFKKAEARVKRFLSQYEKLEVQVDTIEGKLDEARMEMLKDIGMLDTLYEKNLEYFRQLEIYITAGEEKLTELREKTLPALRLEAAKSQDPMDAQVVRDFEDSVNQFEKKLFDLKTGKTLAIQTAPQIKMIQNNDKLLADKIQTAIQETIPLWKSQMVMALGMYRQQEALKLQRSITDTTNAMILKNAEKLRQNTTEVARESERGIVDIETLKKANETLISTMQEAVKIQQEGRAKRAEAEKELVKMEQDIRQTLLG